MAKIRKKKSISKPKKPKISQRNPSEVKIKQYIHNDTKRSNNPPVGLVTSETDKDLPNKKYSYDPHLDPQLTWSGKAENTSFEIDTVSLHVHERIDPLTIIEKVLKGTGEDEFAQKTLFEFFDLPENNPPLREAIEFYKHDQSWSNRLIAGDSLLVMNSLVQKEGLAGHLQMIYVDPPYGISYGSNFQPFVNKRNVKDGKDDDLTQVPEEIKAFRDTWELGTHSYLTYVRDRLLLAKELLADTGSIFVQISDENVHHVRELMDEVFGGKNFVAQIQYRTSGSLSSDFLNVVCDYILWYAKNKENAKIRRIFVNREKDLSGAYSWILLPDGQKRKLTDEEQDDPSLIPENAKLFTTENMVSSGYTQSCIFEFEFEGRKFFPSSGKSWKNTKQGMEELARQGRLIASGETVRYVMLYDDYPVMGLTNMWVDLAGASNKIYVVQTNPKVVQRCMLMTTDPGDLVFDPTCGSGTTAFVAEQWGRRWITCDTSRVSVALTKKRLVTSSFSYYQIANINEGLKGGFKYRTVPHITAGTIANKEPPQQEILYDQPLVDKSKFRITGPFTVEAVPAPVVQSMETFTKIPQEIDSSIVRSGENYRQQQWRDELLHAGVRGKGGQKIEFSRVEPLPGARWIHADAETKEKDPKRVIVSFGPEYAPLERRQVELAIEEAQKLVPKPRIIVFAAFHFESEAGKDIDETNWPGVTILRAQMNGDLFTEDLKKKRTNDESFWLIGTPDIQLKRAKEGKYVVEVEGFDYYNTKSGEIESGDSSKIAMWMLDTDYDGRSLYPQQVFFPIAGTSNGWTKLAKTLKSEIDEKLIEQYRGTTSLPFTPGNNKQIAVKIIDDRGIESMRVLKIV